MPRTSTNKGPPAKKKASKVKMQSIVPTGYGMTAQRFAGKPLRQPGYSFRDVPKCRRDLSGSALYEVKSRDDFNDSMAEMVLLCNEVMRRQADAKTEAARKEGKTANVKRTAKPLSLEYIADRMDVDDPISGFFVRTAAPGAAPPIVPPLFAASVAPPLAAAPPPVPALRPGEEDLKPAAVLTAAAAASTAEASSALSTTAAAAGAVPTVEAAAPTAEAPPAASAAAASPSTSSAAASSASAVAADVSSPLPSAPRRRPPSPRQQAANESAAESAASAASAAINSSSASPSASASQNDRVKEGMLQGFVTVTTFTNWQKSFRWDSMHESAFAYDDPALAEKMKNGERKYDRDGKLSEAMQGTVRCGDAWNEGIVWPRIAEISLLGALGCGRSMVQLAIERLERLPPSSRRNYDFLVLQATTNSIPFYESLGFVRVGCVTDNENFHWRKCGRPPKQGDAANANTNGAEAMDTDAGGEEKKEGDPSQQGSESTNDPSTDSSNSKPSDQGGTSEADKAAAGLPASEIASSPVEMYTTTNDSEKVGEIAKSLDVDVWDVIFLNHFTFPNMAPSSKVLKGTELFIPSKKAQVDACSNALRNISDFGGASDATQWYFCTDNETPKDIAEKFNVECRDLVRRNRDRLSGIQPFSNLIEGTRVQVSHFDRHMDTKVPYCHWTFPDDTIETAEPSYMMALKLNRKSRSEAKYRPVEYSFAVPVSKYENVVLQYADTSSVASSSASYDVPVKQKAKASKKRKRVEKHPDEPDKPKRPLTAYFLYMNEMRDTVKEQLGTNDVKEITRVIAQKWGEVSESERAKFQAQSDRARVDYEAAMKAYEAEMERFRRANPEWVAEQEKIAATNAEIDDASSAASSMKGYRNLFNKIVKLTEDGKREAGTEFEYFYVLTYIPDLQWCHLAPMRKVGKWGPEKPKAQGRPKWMLVNEHEGKEVDISAASVGEIVRSRALRNNPDADKEQWDIPESGPPVPGSEGKPVARVRETYISMDSVESAGSNSAGRWTQAESARFHQAVAIYGKQWKKVSDHVGTRTAAQCKSHNQKLAEGEIVADILPAAKRARVRHPSQFCIVDGCSKLKQNGCDGMCCSHFKNPPPPPPPPSPIKKKKRSWFCKVEGCQKSRQGYCQGMCIAHYTASQKSASAAPPASASSKASSGGKGRTKKPSAKSPAPPKIKKRKGGMCKVQGCPRTRQGNCKGMCATHFRERRSDPREEAINAGATEAELDFAAEIGLPEGWSARENKNSNYLIYSPGKARRFTSKREAFAFAGVEMPPTDYNRRPKKEKVEEVEEEEEEDPPWRLKGHRFIGRTVKIIGEDGSEQIGSVFGWIADTDVDKDGEPGFVSEHTGEPACLFSVDYGDGTNQDFEEHELVNKFIRRTKAAIAAAGGTARNSEQSASLAARYVEPTNGKRKAKGDFCNVEGCPRARQGNCKGMCAAHFKAKANSTLASAAPPASANAAAAAARGPPQIRTSESVPRATKKKSPKKRYNKLCAVPGCTKYEKGKAFRNMCRLHFREFNEKKCSAEDLALPVATAERTVEATANGGGGVVGAAGGDGDGQTSATAAAAASPTAATGTNGNTTTSPTEEQSPPSADKKRPRELEGVSEEDVEAILAALEPARKATRSGREFTSPLVGQL